MLHEIGFATFEDEYGTDTSQEPSQLLGRVSLRENIQSARDRVSLPEGYQYANTVGLKELASLAYTVGWGITVDRVIEDYSYYHSKGLSTLNVGVRDKTDHLVGYGVVVYEGDNGKMANFVVNPAHQHQGLGKAIIDARLNMSEATGVTSLYVDPVYDTNTLRSYYLERGFRETSVPTVIVYGPNPRPVYSPYSP